MLIPAVVEQWAVKVRRDTRLDQVKPQVVIAWSLADEFSKPIPITKDGYVVATDEEETVFIALSSQNARQTAQRLLERRMV